ncbi:hypothetical protein ACFFJX_12665 [Pseudarcicella hirudinis]|uniref:hypothetical protein n=1 Tax=Pseudarcicella hirudinis TaxID=1079859 RepID=UPI0035EAB8F2
MVANYISNSSGQDKYLISVQSDFEPGNIITVTADSKAPISYTVVSGDTQANIESNFNTTSGYYSVNAGVVPVVSVAFGTQEFNNSSAPNVYLTNKIAIAATNVDRYGIYIGDDVSEGNIFTLQDKTYIAQAGDKSSDIASYFGQSSTYFTFDVPTGTQVACYSLPGNKWGSGNIADVRIIQQPTNRKSQHIVAEVNFPDLPSKQFQLALRNKNFQQIIAVGNFVSPTFDSNGSLMVEYSDTGKVFSYEYYEDGLTQIIRLPLFLNYPTQFVQETKTVLLNGGFERTETSINENQSLSVTGKPSSFHRAMSLALKHSFLNISGERYYHEGDWTTNQSVSGIDLFSGNGMLKRYYSEKNNRKLYLLTGSLSNGFSKILLQSDVFGFRLLVKTDNFVRVLSEELIIPANEYKLEFYTGADDVKLDVYEDGSLLRTLLIRSKSKSLINGFIRFYSGKEYQIVATRTVITVITTEQLSLNELGGSAIEYNCEKVEILPTVGGIEGFGYTD